MKLFITILFIFILQISCAGCTNLNNPIGSWHTMAGSFPRSYMDIDLVENVFIGHYLPNLLDIDEYNLYGRRIKDNEWSGKMEYDDPMLIISWECLYLPDNDIISLLLREDVFNLTLNKWIYGGTSLKLFGRLNQHIHVKTEDQDELYSS